MSIRKIDHLVLPVTDLARTRSRLSALGFTVAPDGHHPFGTANACVFLEDGTYLEPLALADRRKAGLAAKRGNVFTERDLVYRGRKAREGFSAFVVASDDAEADHARFVAEDVSGGQPLEFGRMMVSPDGDAVEARFRLAFAAAESSPDFFAFAVQRLVSFPQDMSALRSHANAVTGIKDIVLAAEDPLQAAPLLEQVLQTAGEASETGLAFPVANARVRVLDVEQMAHDFGFPVRGGSTGLSGQVVVFRTADLAVTEIILAANDVAFIRRDGRVLVSPAPGQGVLFGFEE